MLFANSLWFNHCSGSFSLIYYLRKQEHVISLHGDAVYGSSFFILPLHYTTFSPSDPPAITMGTWMWAVRAELDHSPPAFPLLLPAPSTSHFGMALTQKQRGIFIAHTALCIFSSAFVFPRYTHGYPQPFLQSEMLIWHHTWKV